MVELLIKASIAIAISLLFYKLVLQQESFFATNRLYLLSCICLAFVLPFISLPKLIEQQGYLSSLLDKQKAEKEFIASESLSAPFITAEEAGYTLAEQPEPEISGVATPEFLQYPSENSAEISSAAIPNIVQNSKNLSLSSWLMIFYLFGVGIFILSLLYQLGLVFYRIFTARDKIQDGNTTIVITKGDQAPCSFFRYIFINPDCYDYETYDQIISHEKIHVKLGHSLDMLLAELAVIVLWFNPLIWFFRREIEKNIEYQTDAFLLEKEVVHRENYQLSLLQIAVPHKALNITTNYNHSLIKKRIIMMNSKRSTPIAYFKYAFLVPVFFGMLLLINEPAVSQEKQEMVKEQNFSVTNSEEVIQEVTASEEIEESQVIDAKQEILRETVVEQDTQGDQQMKSLNEGQNIVTGVWNSKQKGDKYCVQFKTSADNSTWTRCFDVKAFLQTGNETFVMTKESGAMEITGNLDAAQGQGKFIFTANPDFSRYLASKDITSYNPHPVFYLFLGNVGKNYIDFLIQQYREIDGDRLIELAVHGVTQESFKNYIALFQKHSNKKPSIREVVEAKIHRIDETYVQEMKNIGFTGLSLKKMMEAKIHGVNADYVDSLKKSGFNNLSIDEIIRAKIYKVNPATINEKRALGKEEIGIDKIAELQIHNVNADYINELESAGLNNLTLDQVISAKIHGLSESFIKEIRNLGYKNISFNELLSARIHKVDAHYVKGLQEAGLSNLTIDEITTAKIHRLDPQSIKEIRDLGFSDLSFPDLMSAQIHRVNTNYVEDLRKAGFSNLEMDEIVSAKIHGIDRKFIENAKSEGYNFDSLEKYISLKIHSGAIKSLSSNNKDN